MSENTKNGMNSNGSAPVEKPTHKPHENPIIEGLINVAVAELERSGAIPVVETVKRDLPPAPQPFIYESVTRAHDKHSGATIRVWRKERTCPVYSDEEILNVISRIPGHASMEEVFDTLARIPRITKIELTDSNGLGAVAYYK